MKKYFLICFALLVAPPLIGDGFASLQEVTIEFDNTNRFKKVTLLNGGHKLIETEKDLVHFFLETPIPVNDQTHFIIALDTLENGHGHMTWFGALPFSRHAIKPSGIYKLIINVGNDENINLPAGWELPNLPPTYEFSIVNLTPP